MAVEKHRPRPHLDEYHLADGRTLCLLAEGRLVNLAAAEGHPSSVMDMSFSCQALSINYLVESAQTLKAGLHPVPEIIDQEVATLKLSAMGITIDTLTDEQRRYLTSWLTGT
jgi:adenosylhomocysteinase